MGATIKPMRGTNRGRLPPAPVRPPGPAARGSWRTASKDWAAAPRQAGATQSIIMW